MHTAEIGPDHPTARAIAALVKGEIVPQAAAGFPTLRRIPSSGVVRLLDYMDSLTGEARAALLDAQARLAALHFFPAPLIARAHERLRTTEPAIAHLHEAMRSPMFSMGLRYEDLRMSRAMLNDPESMRHMATARAALDFVPRDDPPEALLDGAAIRDARPAKAPLLRKLLTPMLRARLAASAPVKKPGGELVYEGAIGGVPLRVSIIFSNRFGQMHYAVGWSLRERSLLAQRLSYELLFGTNTGWDYLTEENAARSVDLLGELLDSLAGLLARIAALPRPE